MSAPHAVSAAETAASLQTDMRRGLTSAEAADRKTRYGANRLQEMPRPGLAAMLREQLNDFLIWLLILAAVVSAGVGYVEGQGYAESMAIVLIVILNAAIGVFQERRAENAMRALVAMATPEASVIRDARHVTIPAIDLVPGDLVLLETGNYVPADLRLVTAVNLRLDEAALTGESAPVAQHADLLYDTGAPLGDRCNMAYSGTTVAYGRGSGIVVATGMATEIGRIAEMIQGFEHEPTPLQGRLEQLGRSLGKLTIVVCAIVFAVGLTRDTQLGLLAHDPAAYAERFGPVVIELFMVAVALAIAAVPEGLPAVVTIALAIGMQRMAKRNALIRRLPAVETLGSATVICSDKTGTLTQNEMVVVQIELEGRTLEVSGRGYGPDGEITLAGAPVTHVDDADLQLLATAATLASDAIVEADGGGWRLIGDPTEGALVAFAARTGLDRAALVAGLPRIAEIPFDSSRKRMTTIHRPTADWPVPPVLGGGSALAFVKGAPDVVLGLSSRLLDNGQAVELDDAMRERVEAANREMARQALRVLGVACRALPSGTEAPDTGAVERDLTFIGLVGIIDPPRSEVPQAVALARQAGIRSVMVTGDYVDTAIAIGRTIGLIRPSGQVVSAQDLEAMDEATLAARVDEIDVFARVSPEHKVRIVEALKTRGEVVAMTGDGVNDAPALKRSHIGVAMGLTGTDVSRETADMVLTDDNFASIVAAIEEGRTIYSNIRKSVYYLLSCNIGEILIIFSAMLLGIAGGQPPLLPIHLLWLNLVTDGLPALALAMEPAERDVMRRPPRDPEEPVLSRELWPLIGAQAVVDALATLSAFVWAWSWRGDMRFAQTVAFATLVTAELLRAYTSRSQHESLLRLGVLANRWMVLATATSFALLLVVLYVPKLVDVFSTVPLALAVWPIILGFAVLPATAAEIAKAWLRRRSPPDGADWRAGEARAA